MDDEIIEGLDDDTTDDWDDDDGDLVEEIDLSVEPDDSVWNELPENKTETNQNDWDLEELAFDDDDYIEADSNEDSDDGDTSISDWDVESDVEEADSEDTSSYDVEDDDEEASPEE